MAEVERLGTVDLLNLSFEARNGPLYVAALAVVDGRALVDDHGRLRLEELRGRIEQRIVTVPRLW